MRIEIGSQATIYDIEPDLEALIKRTVAEEEDIPLLRVINPDYDASVRFGSKFGRPNKWWTGYFDNKEDGTFIVPRAWMLSVVNAWDIQCEITYDLAEASVDFPEPDLTPLDHQEDAMNAFFKQMNHNDTLGRPTDTCIVLNTSAGKTILGMFIAYHCDQRTLLVVPTKEIEAGWVGDARKLFGMKDSKEIGQIRGKNIRIGEHLTVGSVQTLMNLDPALWADKFGMIILDELHGMAAKCFSRVLQECNASIRLGLTATDNRRDGMMPVVHWHLGINCYKDMTPMNCTDLTYMGVMYKDPLPTLPDHYITDDKKMKTRKNKYEKAYIHKQLLKRRTGIDDLEAMREIRKGFKEYYSDLDLPDITRKSKESPFQYLLRQLITCSRYNDFILDLCEYIIANYEGDILISSVSTDHIAYLADRLRNEFGIKVAELVGTVTKGREKLYEDIKSGMYPITIGTQSIVSKGASNPRWAHVIIATPFANEEVAVQIKGRPIRLDPANPNKTMGYVWDLVTITERMAKNMGRSRFKAIEPYKQHHEWMDHSDIKESLDGEVE